MMQRQAQISKPEERFVELFQEVFGPAAAAKLEPQVFFVDIFGKERYIDFALDSLLDRYALEIDGETYHHPQALTSEDYADQLLRQNSLVHQGWRVLRWTDRQIAQQPDSVKQQLSILLDQAIRLTVPQEYLPCKRGSMIDLYEHQADALENLERMRADGQQIALLAHAVGTGKTTTAAEDARRMGLRTLFLAHTHELVTQAYARFGELWPGASRAVLGDGNEEHAQVVVGTVQFMSQNLAQFDPCAFGYIVIDEAHHALSKSYRAVLRYFNPQFLLGLTGTPERADGQNALEVFQQTAHRMDLETAVKSGVLCDIRCFRVETNVDLKRLRFNGNLYNQRDLEERVSVPERNHLIVSTYKENTPSRPAVCFCVSVGHAERMAQLFAEAGFAARAVSGRLSKEQRQEILQEYEAGRIQVLCACDVLNEGWDAPQTEVLLMARPTLSKVIYQQQIGRGMRTHPGKKYLVLFDFVDVFGRHNRSLNIHRLTKKPNYRPGDSIFTSDNGEAVEIDLAVWGYDLSAVDVFDWQEKVEGMLTGPALSKRLRRNEQWVGDKYKTGEITADEVVELGEGRAIPYFKAERESELRDRYGIQPVTEDSLYDEFLRFLNDMDMTRSYKPVWFLALLECTDKEGRAPVSKVVAAFLEFYRKRKIAGEITEVGNSAVYDPDTCTQSRAQQTINRGPFRSFSYLGYVGYANDVAYYQMHKRIWTQLKNEDVRRQVEETCRQSLQEYYLRAAFSTGATPDE